MRVRLFNCVVAAISILLISSLANCSLQRGESGAVAGYPFQIPEISTIEVPSLETSDYEVLQNMVLETEPKVKTAGDSTAFSTLWVCNPKRKFFKAETTVSSPEITGMMGYDYSTSCLTTRNSTSFTINYEITHYHLLMPDKSNDTELHEPLSASVALKVDERGRIDSLSGSASNAALRMTLESQVVQWHNLTKPNLMKERRIARNMDWYATSLLHQPYNHIGKNDDGVVKGLYRIDNILDTDKTHQVFLSMVGLIGSKDGSLKRVRRKHTFVAETSELVDFVEHIQYGPDTKIQLIITPQN